jgi:hypothetical protein
LGDWAVASGGRGGWLVAADLLVFIRMMIFYNGRFLLCHKKLGCLQFFLFDTQSIAHDVLQVIQTWRT